MFRAFSRPSLGAYNYINSLWFYRWNVVVAELLVVVWPDPNQQCCYHHAPTVKPEAVNAVVSSWWWAWGGPETCWATHKRQVINLWNCCIWFVNLFELYDDARNCQRQTGVLSWPSVAHLRKVVKRGTLCHESDMITNSVVAV
jgi:hypothetical protein